jgi:hypothetical protein
MKPEYKTTMCSMAGCTGDAVALVTTDQAGTCSVEWCEHGHVIVIPIGKPVKLVYDFSE